MSKRVIAVVRKDPKGRNLRPGEYYDEVKKRYKYRYRDENKKYHDVYAFRLTDKDPIPYDKPEKYRVALRELEKQIEDDLKKHIDTSAGNMSVYALVTEYVAYRTNPRNPKRVKESTAAGYKTVLNFLAKNPMGKRHIRDVLTLEAKTWFTDLQHDRHEARETDGSSIEGKGYSQLNSIKGVLKPAYQYAKEKRWVETNPFDFKMDVLVDDSETREAISPKDMRRFLDFVWSSRVYHKYFDMMYILFCTGMRVSEFCGLTVDDIDLDNKVIYIRRELMYKAHIGHYLDTVKTSNGYREVPMIPGVDKAFENLLKSRPVLSKEPVIWDAKHKWNASGFLMFTRNGKPRMETEIAHIFKYATNRFNAIYKNELPEITPHVCRHTFITNMVSRGMPLAKLKAMAGHAEISTTLDIYTHMGIDALSDEVNGRNVSKNYVVYPYPEDGRIDMPALDYDMPEEDFLEDEA